jgi:hypothetical protein
MAIEKTPDKRNLISRRDFSIAGGAIITAGPLSACAPQAIASMLTMKETKSPREAAKTTASPTHTLEVLNPRGEVDPPKTLGISPRVSSLAGKRIGLYDNGKEGFADFLNVIEKLLKDRYPTATVVRFNGGFDCGDALAAKMAKSVDTVIYGSGD